MKKQCNTYSTLLWEFDKVDAQALYRSIMNNNACLSAQFEKWLNLFPNFICNSLAILIGYFNW